MHLIFIPKVGLFGSDAHYDFNLIELIYYNGWSLGLQSTLAAWPAMHIYINVCSEILGTPLMSTARYIPSIISSVTLFFIYCLNKLIYRQRHVSLFNSLLFSTLAYFSFFHSLPIRESFAFFIMSIAIYVYFKSLYVGSQKFMILSIFYGLFLALCHHFTLFIYVSFLITFYACSKAIKYKRLSFHYDSNSINFKVFHNYLLLMVVTSLSYWIFVSFSVFNELVTTAKNFIGFGDLEKEHIMMATVYPPLIDLRTQIASYSSVAVFLLVGIVLIYNFIYLKNKLNFSEISIFAFLVFTFSIWVLSTLDLLHMSIYPERLELFAWFFLLVPLSYIIFKNIFQNKKSFIHYISILFVISFVLMNVTQYPAYFYDPSLKPSYENGQKRFNYLPQEYAAIHWFTGEGNILSDRTTDDLLNQRLRSRVYSNPDFFNGNLSMKENYDWFILRKEMFEIIVPSRLDRYTFNEPVNLSIDTYVLIDNSPSVNKLYYNSEVSIYSVNNNNFD
jgi:hypothetical protein